MVFLSDPSVVLSLLAHGVASFHMNVPDAAIIAPDGGIGWPDKGIS